jgi:hypothetical protein
MKTLLATLAFGLILLSANAVAAQSADGREPCAAAHRFDPGPIVNGHHRQPTAAEVEARSRELRASIRASAGSCAAAPRSREASTQRGRSETGPEGS